MENRLTGGIKYRMGSGSERQLFDGLWDLVAFIRALSAESG